MYIQKHLYTYCDNDIVSRVAAKCQSLSRIERNGTPKVTNVFTLMLCESRSWELVSPELVWTSYNVAVSLRCVLRDVTRLSLSRNSSFKRSWELLIGVSTCLYDLQITWSLIYKYLKNKPNWFFTIMWIYTYKGNRALHLGWPWPYLI